ncbi:unnamed protein product [Ixodes hexagonus]
MLRLHMFSTLLRRCLRSRFGSRSLSTTPVTRTPNPPHGAAKTLPYEVDSNVAKNTELYRYDNFRVFAALRIFGVSQVFLWTYLAYVSQTLFDDPKLVSKMRKEDSGEEKTFAQTLAEKLTVGKYRNSLTAFCLIFANGVVAAASIYMLRSVRSVVLLKGGQSVYIQTYAPFRTLRGFQVPLEHLNCLHSRGQKSAYISLKVKGRWFYFMLDQKGLFPHPQLFDQTVGLSRILK